MISNCRHFTLDPVKVNQFLTRLICRKCGYCAAVWESESEEVRLRNFKDLHDSEKEDLR